MTAVLRFPGRERSPFCRPVLSRVLGRRPMGPYGGPRPLRTRQKPVDDEQGSLIAIVCYIILSNSGEPIRTSLSQILRCSGQFLEIFSSYIEIYLIIPDFGGFRTCWKFTYF